jgi:hypothetical protein
MQKEKKSLAEGDFYFFLKGEFYDLIIFHFVERALRKVKFLSTLLLNHIVKTNKIDVDGC